MRFLTITLFVLISVSTTRGQTFYFNTKKKVVRDHKQKQRKLKKTTGIDLPFPFKCVWLMDSVFIQESEVTLSWWSSEYAILSDSTLIREEAVSFLQKYNVDSIYNTKSQVAYSNLIRYSALLSSFLYGGKTERPLVFVDSTEIFSFIKFLNQEFNSIIQKKEPNWFWDRFYNTDLSVEYSLPSVEDYLIALKMFNKWTPTIEITTDIDSTISVPVKIYKNFKEGDHMIGLTDNASEVIKYEGGLYVVYKVTRDKIYISRLKTTDFHIGFRLKCRLRRNSA